MAGQPIVITTGSHAYWVAEQSVTYRLRVSFFDSVATGLLDVGRD